MTTVPVSYYYVRALVFPHALFLFYVICLLLSYTGKSLQRDGRRQTHYLRGMQHALVTSVLLASGDTCRLSKFNLRRGPTNTVKIKVFFVLHQFT